MKDKKNSARQLVFKKEYWVAVSGGFDPLHIGHVQLFKQARALGTHLVVIVNNDNWLKSKKGFSFLPQQERVALIRELSCVDKVVLTNHKENDSDMSVSRALRILKPAIFANGGDRTKENTPEDEVCKKYDITMKFGIGGGKIQSSSWLVKDAVKTAVRTIRPWGTFFDWDGGESWHLKTIYVEPKKRLSLQYHHLRKECWVLVEGEVSAVVSDGTTKKLVSKKLKTGEPFFIKKKQIHRLVSEKGGVIVEIALGDFKEDDIVRLSDDFGRV
jgi:D-beta-D-heptose 7-phosphate kinase/D-beta-D-heptose 1-phosphate adenosyltransferase